ncbi:hypothetical protein [Paenibacillus polymyxa]|uniref:hypothetical protein n=1 Tax=Paenibacillus polymyxa TaxID=1406 RepID=UPI002018783D|nr:hypothetical protein [Paenibacillus polymyxa]UQQ36167.1 hypothetical protein LMH85_04410 [Paenibacillus polymyxa]
MSKRLIKDEVSWELGHSYGIMKAMQRFMDHYFDQLKEEYFKCSGRYKTWTWLII